MKLLIFGIDGMSMNFINKHIEKFDLLRNGMNKGCYSKMPAPSKRGDKWNTSMDMWTCLYTGLSADEHNLGGKYVRNMKKTRAEAEMKTLIDLEPEVKERFFWNILNKRGYKVGLFNGIAMNPAFPIKGFMYGSFPQHSNTFFYPKELQSCFVNTLDKNTGQPRPIKDIDKITHENVEQVYEKIGFDYFYNGVIYTFSELMAHYETIINMTKQIPVDVLFYYNLRLDLIQHFSFHDPSDKIIIQAYQVYEIMLAKLIERFKPENVMVISDHGLERSKSGAPPNVPGAVPVPNVKDTNICLSINKCVLSGRHSEEAVFILWGKDIKEKGEIKNIDIIKAYDKILEVCK